MTAAKFTVERHAGRLLEARVFALWSEADAEEYANKFQLVARAFPAGAKPVLLADHRPVRVYPTAVAVRLVELFTTMNLSLERAALLVTRGNVPLTLQLQRLVESADYSARRLFSEPADALAHVSAVLDPAEAARAASFLDGYEP